MKIIIVGVLVLPFFTRAHTLQKFTDLFNAGRVGVKIISLGGHVDKCVDILFTNNTAKPVTFELEPGLLLDSENNNQQNLVTAQKEVISVLPGKPIHVLVSAFCIQARNLSPRPGSTFLLRGYADSNLVRLANFIDAQKICGELAQQAFWVISDNNPLESVSAGSEDLKQKVISFLTQTFKIKRKGNYEIIYRHLPDVAFSGQALKVKGKIAYHLEEGGYNSLLIQDAKGRTYATIMYRKFEKSGNYERDFEFRVNDLPKGVYYARLYSNQKIIAEVEIDLS